MHRGITLAWGCRETLVVKEEKMVLLFAIPSLLFLGGLGMMMWAEAKYTRRDESERDPMFVRKSR